MHRKNFGGGSGVIIDWCRGHGYWFDATELEKIMAYVRAGGLDRARERQIEDARREAERARDAAQQWQQQRASFLGDPPGPDLLGALASLLRRLLT